MSQQVRLNLVWYAMKYFADEINRDWYIKLFDLRGQSKYCADFSNLYAQMDSAAWGQVRDCAENIKVVFTLRHPLRRLWSHAKFQSVFSGSETNPSRWRRKDFEEFFQVSGALDHGDYAAIITRLRHNIAEEDLKLLFFEEMHERPKETLNGIEDWLGIEARHYETSRLAQQVNATESLEMPKGLLQAAKGFHKEQLEKLSNMGLRVPEAWTDI